MAQVTETRRVHREKTSIDATITDAEPRETGKHDYQPTRLLVDYSRDTTAPAELGIRVRITGPHVDSSGKPGRTTLVEDVFVLDEAPDWVRTFVNDNNPWKDGK